MLRSAVSPRTSIGLKVAQIMERGELVPDQLVVSVIVERISQSDVARGFILDGFPRTVFQAAALDDVLLIEERELSCVLELKVDERILLDRILGRAVQAKGQRRAGESR
jgi:adenylate kinase